jgi:hypothetical protein
MDSGQNHAGMTIFSIFEITAAVELIPSQFANRADEVGQGS